ncbi:hypothetical protein ACP4OV_024032 [Aristida adscensionis]
MGGGDRRAGRPPPLPPGFRFRPTDEELLTHYLARKAADAAFAPAAVRDVDLYKAAGPWDLLPPAAGGGGEDAAGGAGGGADDGCCYFFCRRSVKFPSGLRTNRATPAGYWKSTGKDKVVMRHGGGGGAAAGECPLGVKKTLVFYRGRAPRGDKTGWVMHEYRLLQGHAASSPPVLARGSQSEWVICRMFTKNPPGERQEHETAVLHHPPHDDHLQPSMDAGRCDDGKTPAVASTSDDSEHVNFFSDILAMAPPCDRETDQAGGVLHQHQLGHHEELLMNCPESDLFALSAPPPPAADHQLLDDGELALAGDSSFDDLLPQLLDYEGLHFPHDYF